MIRRRVSLTVTAQAQIGQRHRWWMDNRDQHQVFEVELAAALNLVALLPGIGTPYQLSPILGVRRLYLDKIDSHLYYTYDDEQVTIRSLWGARRGGGPALGS